MAERSDSPEPAKRGLENPLIGMVVGGAIGVGIDRLAGLFLDAPDQDPAQIPMENESTWLAEPDALTGDPWTFRAELLHDKAHIRVQVRAWRDYPPLIARFSSIRAIRVNEIPLKHWMRYAWVSVEVPAFGETTLTLDWMWADLVARTATVTVSPDMEGIIDSR